MNDLYQLAYVSQASRHDDDIAGEEEIDLWQLQLIRDAMSRRNQQEGITSAIIFHQGCYAQLLEGPQRALRQCFDRISADRRHHHVRTVEYQPVRSRQVNNPAMIFYDYLAEGLCLLGDDGELVSTRDIRCSVTSGILNRLKGLLDQREQPSIPATSIPKLVLS